MRSAEGTLECYTRFCRYSDRSLSAGTASISIKKRENIGVSTHTQAPLPPQLSYWFFLNSGYYERLMKLNEVIRQKLSLYCKKLCERIDESHFSEKRFLWQILTS